MKNKYIAWDFRNNKMVLDAVVLTETNQLVTVNANYFNSPFSFFDGCAWLKFTGLLDMNKKEIYEGASDGKRTIIYSAMHAGYVFYHAPDAFVSLTRFTMSNAEDKTLADGEVKVIDFEIKGYMVPKSVGSSEFVFVENPVMTKE